MPGSGNSIKEVIMSRYLPRLASVPLLFLVIAATPTFAQAPDGADSEGSFRAATAAALKKICKGQWEDSSGNEQEVKIECTSVNETCTCTADKVKCGGEKSAPSGTTFVAGSCEACFESAADTLPLPVPLFASEGAEDGRAGDGDG